MCAFRLRAVVNHHATADCLCESLPGSEQGLRDAAAGDDAQAEPATGDRADQLCRRSQPASATGQLNASQIREDY